MKFSLRYYQQYIIDNIKDRTIAVLPTGAGKTAVICALAEQYHKDGKTVLIVVPTIDLKNQVNVTLSEQQLTHAAKVAVYKSAHKIKNVDVYIHDEVHHSACDTWDKLIKNNSLSIHLGLTASPFRLDGKPLDNFDKVLEPVTTFDLIKQGFLCPGLDEYSVDIGTVLEDFNDLEGQYQQLNKKYIYATIIENYLKYCTVETKSVVFCVSIAHCEDLKQQFDKVGVISQIISYKDTPTVRKQKLEDFKAGRIRVLLNVTLITEGVDIPDCECVVMCRFASLGLYLQMVGRALRKKPKNAILLDFVGNLRHGSVLSSIGFSHVFYEAKTQKEQATTSVPFCKFCYSVGTLEEYLKTGVCPTCSQELLPVSLNKLPIPLPKEIQGQLVLYKVSNFDQALQKASKIKSLEGFAVALKRCLKMAETPEIGLERITEMVESKYRGKIGRQILEGIKND